MNVCECKSACDLRASSLCLLRGLQGPNPGSQAFTAIALPTKSSRWPSDDYIYNAHNSRAYALLTVLETSLKGLLHKVDGCVPLLLVWYGPVFQRIVLNDPLKRAEKANLIYVPTSQ